MGLVVRHILCHNYPAILFITKFMYMPTTKSRTASKRKTSASTATANGNSQLEKLFHDSLKDIYWAEKHLLKALPKMQKNATTEQLQDAIEEHITQTEGQVERLEQVFDMLGHKAQGKKCEAMEGLIREGESVISETEEDSMTRDAGIIMAAQKVEHYEIATYGTLVTLAKVMGQDDVAALLEETLEEEKETDENLTAIAENDINWEAGQEGDEE
jgi:ferritin-like metal-binding protein YciE